LTPCSFALAPLSHEASFLQRRDAAATSFALAPLSHEPGWSLLSSVLNNTALYGSTILAVATNGYDADGRVAVVSDWANKAIY